MTYSNAARQIHFQRRTGSSSQTGFGNAWAPGGDPVEILPTVKQQYEQYKLLARQTRTAMETATGKERELARQKLAEAIRHIGNLRETLKAGSRVAFEKIFTQVASYRLPKDRFLILVEEAREIWREEGFADFVPPPTQGDKRAAAKRETRRMLSKADAHFEA